MDVRCSFIILRDKQSIEFRDTDNLSKIIYNHSVAPHKPGRLCTVGSSFLLYDDRSKRPRDIHWLDCSGDKPKLLKEKSFTTSLRDMWDFVRVQNVANELIIGVDPEKGIHCYNTVTKSLEWSVARKLPGMQKPLHATCITSGWVWTYVCI